MPPSTLHVLLIGDTSRPEFREAVAALDELAHVTRFADVEAATAALAEGMLTAHVIVLAQAYPDQFSAAAIDRLRSLAPLARLIAILGSWCEGEPRSGHPLPGVIRMYWHQAAVAHPPGVSPLVRDPRFRVATAGHRDGRRTIAGLDPCAVARGPGTGRHLDAAARNGMLAFGRLPQGRLFDGLVAPAPASPRAGRRGRDLRRRLVGCRRAGRTQPVDRRRFAPAPVLALLDAPRIQDVRLARTLGAAVLAKPFRGR